MNGGILTVIHLMYIFCCGCSVFRKIYNFGDGSEYVRGGGGGHEGVNIYLFGSERLQPLGETLEYELN